MTLDVLLVEGWMAGSHEAWAEGWRSRSRHRIDLVTQPGTHWQHRMTAGSVPLASAVADHVSAHGSPDVLVVTDMVDLASLLGLVGSMSGGALSRVPSVLYLHENQLTQPPSPNGVGGGRGRHLGWTNWRSMVAADAVWSNSQWQLTSLFESLGDMLGEAPDSAGQLPLVPRVRERCSVQPVGCDLADLLASRPNSGASDGGGGGPDGPAGECAAMRAGEVSDEGAYTGVARGVGQGDVPGDVAGDGGGEIEVIDDGREVRPPLVLWNHRWSHDKGLSAAVTSMKTLAAEGLDFEVAVVGADDHHDPGRAQAVLAPLAERIVHTGWMERDDYRDLLTTADVVVAAPLQENFGISVVEAVAAGCIPVVPDALSYPETIDEPSLRYPEGRLTTHLRSVLMDPEQFRPAAQRCRSRLVRFDWQTVAAAYDSAVEQLVDAAHAPPAGR